jgi:hypothetical protein
MVEEIVTKYLNQHIFQLDKLLDKKQITLGEYLMIGVQLKILEKMDRFEAMMKEEPKKGDNE